MSAGSSKPGCGAERIFGVLLRLYPASFRDLYETDARELFRDRLSEARSGGRLSVWLLWARTVPNLVVHGLLERAADLSRSEARPDRGASLFAAARRLVRSPGLSAVVVGTLGLGIGANVALYSVLRSVLLRPLPYPEAERLVQLWETNPDVDEELHGPSPWNFHDWSQEVDGFESMTAWYLTSATFRGEEWAEEVRSAQVTADFFRTLGVAPEIGRGFQTDEVTRYGPVILSHALWERRFGGDPGIIGRGVTVSGATYEIVGVMPLGFAFPDESVDAWIAWSLPGVYDGNLEARTWRFLHGLARLAPGVTTGRAEEQLDQIAAGLAETYPDMNRGWDAAVTSLHEDVVGDVRGTLWIAFGAVLFILVIACVNVANLLLVRVPARSREVSLRATLGASRGRIATELAVEHLMLGATAGVLGLGFGRLFIDALVALDAGRIPRLSEVAIDPAIYGFTAVVAILTSVVFGGAPMLELLRGGSAEASLRTTRTTAGTGQRRIREAFVGVQMAVALVLLAGAGVFSASLQRLTRVDAGIDPQNVGTFRVSLDPVAGDPGATARYYEELLATLGTVPGVLSVGASQTTPLNPVANDFRRPYRGTGSGVLAADAPSVQMRIVTPGYVETMGMTLLAGTGIPAAASADAPLVAVVNETLARRLWPDGNAVGESLDIDFRVGWQPYRIVGVVRDVRHYGPRSPVQPEVFLAHAQSPYLAMTLVVRTEGDPALRFDELRDVVLAQVPMQPPHNFVTMEGLLSSSIAEERFLSVLLSVFAGIGLLLACTGVYGVIACSVGHRRREIGVRMALGAEPATVVRSVFREAMLVAGAGVLVGIGVILALRGVVERLLFEAGSADRLAVVGLVGMLTLISAVAAWLPARRAARIAPSESLRAE